MLTKERNYDTLNIFIYDNNITGHDAEVLRFAYNTIENKFRNHPLENYRLGVALSNKRSAVIQTYPEKGTIDIFINPMPNEYVDAFTGKVVKYDAN